MISKNQELLFALMPHRPPHLLLHALCAWTATSATALAVLSEGNPYLGEDGRLEPVAMAELIAQCFAAGAGAYQQSLGKKQPQKGYLAALRDFRVYGDAYRGQTLTVTVERIASLGAIIVVQGEVRCGDTLLATSQCKVAVFDQSST